MQIKLAPVNAPYFNGARLLIAADCTAYAYGDFHERFIRGRVTLVGCPKLDGVDYAEKLTAILRDNDIRDVTIVRMEVPCCGGLEQAGKTAIQASGKFLPWQGVSISTDGRILGWGFAPSKKARPFPKQFREGPRLFCSISRAEERRPR